MVGYKRKVKEPQPKPTLPFTPNPSPKKPKNLYSKSQLSWQSPLCKKKKKATYKIKSNQLEWG
jgi:hypothetical protein